MSWRNSASLLLLVLLQPGCVLFTGSFENTIQPTQDGPSLSGQKAARACQAVAESLANQGHLQEAIEQLQKARLHNPQIDVSPALARLHARLRQDQAALDEFGKALKAHPRDGELWNDLGYLHYERGNWKEAEHSLRRAVEFAPNHGRAWMNLGLTLGQMQQYQESLRAFEKACRPAEARCNLAFVYTTQGKHEEARALYQEALQIDPGMQLARKGLAILDKPTRSGVPTLKQVPDNRGNTQRVESQTSLGTPVREPSTSGYR